MYSTSLGNNIALKESDILITILQQKNMIQFNLNKIKGFFRIDREKYP